MASDAELEIYRQQRQGQDKYMYFLLAAVGASIAFALNQTKGLPLTASQWPLGVAVVCWAGSFLAGCSRILTVEQALNLNQGLIRVKRGTHEDLPHAGYIPEASQLMRENLAKVNGRSVRRAKWQYLLLILGAAFYIGWHVYEMSLRTSRISNVGLKGELPALSVETGPAIAARPRERG